MIDFYALEHALCGVFAPLLEVQCQPVDEPEVFPQMTPGTQARATLQIFGVAAVGGADETTFGDAPVSGWVELPWGEEWAAETAKLRQTTRAVREVTVRIKVTAYNQRWAARLFLERLRDRLPWMSTTAALAALGLGFSTTASLTDLSTRLDERARSIAVIDFRFTLGTVDTDPTDYYTIDKLGEVSGSVTP